MLEALTGKSAQFRMISVSFEDFPYMWLSTTNDDWGRCKLTERRTDQTTTVSFDVHAPREQFRTGGLHASLMTRLPYVQTHVAVARSVLLAMIKGSRR